MKKILTFISGLDAIVMETAVQTGLRVDVKKIGVIWNVDLWYNGFTSDM